MDRASSTGDTATYLLGTDAEEGRWLEAQHRVWSRDPRFVGPRRHACHLRTTAATQAGSFLLDLTWLTAGLVFWWWLIAPVPQRSGVHPLGKIAYLALNAFLIRPPFAMMVFSEHPIYATYELAPPPGGDELGDQQFAGVIMKIGLAWIMFAGVVAVFQRWRRAEQEGVHPTVS